MRVMASRGVPPRGSIQDRIACEMLMRERKRIITEKVYLARIMSAGMQMPERLFKLWTSLFTLEIYQENYTPETVSAKQEALQILEDTTKTQTEGRVRMFRKLQRLEVTEDGLRPVTPKEIEIYKRKLRKRHLQSPEGQR